MKKSCFYYRLDENRRPVPAVMEDSPDRKEQLVAWAAWWEANHFMADDRLGDIRVATIFLGLDPNHGFGPVTFFESAVFSKDAITDMRRYATYEEAMAGHAELLRRFRGH